MKQLDETSGEAEERKRKRYFDFYSRRTTIRPTTQIPKRGLFRNVLHTKSYAYMTESEFQSTANTIADRFKEMSQYSQNLQETNQVLDGKLDVLNKQLAQVFNDE